MADNDKYKERLSVGLDQQTDKNFNTGNYGNNQDALNAYRDAVSSGDKNLIESVTNSLSKGYVDYYKDPNNKATTEDPAAEPVYGSKTVEDYSPTTYAQKADQDYSLGKLTSLENQGRPTYTGNYDQQIAQLLDDIYNRGEFTYNYNEDPLYQQYAESYMNNGRKAMKDSMAGAASLTGGYGSTYGSMVGQQAYNTYAQGLADKIPDLYQLAASRYDTETATLNNKLNTFNNQDQIDYGEFRDNMGDYDTDLNYWFQRYLADQSQNNYLTELYQQYHKLDPNYAEKQVRTLLGYK